MTYAPRKLLDAREYIIANYGVAAASVEAVDHALPSRSRTVLGESRRRRSLLGMDGVGGLLGIRNIQFWRGWWRQDRVGAPVRLGNAGRPGPRRA